MKVFFVPVPQFLKAFYARYSNKFERVGVLLSFLLIQVKETSIARGHAENSGPKPRPAGRKRAL
jgi:hypothetical protein